MEMTCAILKAISEKEEEIFQHSMADYKASLQHVASWKLTYLSEEGESDENDENERKRLALVAALQEIQEMDEHTSLTTYRRLYYQVKLGISVEDEHELTALANEYYRGLQWVLQYYNQGVPSWSWMFPHHYSPFASDVANYLR